MWDLENIYNFLNFYINKNTGSWYTISELTQTLDFGQMAVYSDMKPKYATSQLIKDALSPFRQVYNFTTLVSGVIIVPDTAYEDLLSIQTYYEISGRRRYASVKLYNEDELPDVLNSQLTPVTITSPAGEQIAPKTFRLYPANAYNGNVTYLTRPVAPVYGYTVISGRVIVYNPSASTQLQWRDSEIPMILIKALNSIGINIGSQEVQGWAQVKSEQNYMNNNRL